MHDEREIALLRALKKATKEGYVSLNSIKMVICGPPCVGKTAFKNLLLNKPWTFKHNSTPIADRPVQAIERIAAGENTWEEVTEEDLLHMLSDAIEKPTLQKELSTDAITPAFSPQLNLTELSHDGTPSPSSPSHDLLTLAQALSILQVPTSTDTAPQPNRDIDFFSKKIMKQLGTAKKSKRSQSQKLHEATWIHLLDSGGQPQFTDLLRMFVRDNSLYIIVMKATESLHDKPRFVYSIDGKAVSTPNELTMTNIQIIENFVHSVVRAARDKTSSSKPAFAIVVTHCDKLDKSNRKEKVKKANELIQKYLREFLHLFVFYKPQSNKLVFPVDNQCWFDRKKISEKIRLDLLSSRSDISIQNDIPVRWYVFDLNMKDEASKETHGMISLQSCYDIGSKFSMSKNEVDQCLIYLDSMRLCIYYPKILPNVVFTNPQFLINSLSNIVRVSFVNDLKQILPKGVSLSDDTVCSLKRDGVFDESLLDSLQLTFIPNMFSKSDLLTLLQHFRLISPIKVATNDTPRYFIPILLPAERLTEEMKAQYSESIDPFVITFNSRLVPQVSY